MNDHAMPATITTRELDVLRLMCKGMPTKKIAAALKFGEKAIECHRAKLRKKTGCRTACELGVWAARNGLADVNTNTTRAAAEAHSSDRVSPITEAAALLSAKGTPTGAGRGRE